ncbi:rhodanese-like domain-containing protein [Nodosilinea sp. PGN35]|uniref:rhodanese-like domain-containing protein n=1 Tax=Nodosilinea sp. PGN35 TaxID=3020489 RepID=UPI0023B33921|nr:MBL fold metallo-hydrolase [Nodosilinea sp. TSF1-S3]MDF0366712.1 rhodanese-like domain-containing protein [Nodosilinea sp. TSF1-S3]
MDQALVFRQLFDADSSTYTYLLADPVTQAAVLIDPVFEQHGRDRALIEELGLTLLVTLDTHCHADHVTGAWLMQQAVGSKIAISGRYGDMVKGADYLLDHGDTVTFGRRTLEVRATPGHTDGCITYVLDDHSMAFTGDCLLIRGAGRCDFQQGDAKRMYASITEQIFSLPADCTIWPAHDYSGRTSSTVAEEKAHNPRIGGQADETDFVGYMENLGLPHPKKIDIALPANCVCGQPEDGKMPTVADWGPVRLTYGGVKEIDPQWVAENLSSVHVLDVRGPDEFNAELGHIREAQLVPLSQLEDRMAEISAQQPVVAVCKSGRRSALATAMLKKHGHPDAASLRGGMLGWNDAHLPVARD